VAELVDRVPAAALAGVLHGDPRLARHLRLRAPEAAPRIDALLAAHGPIPAAALIGVHEAVVWEVADLVAYERAPALYDERSGIPFAPVAVTSLAPLAGAVVVDVGAGTGRVALALAPLARQVVAVEPVAALRRYLRRRAAGAGVGPLLVTDGFLDAVPLPAESADVLVTCHAIGWRLDAELAEIHRVLRRGGVAVHLFAQPPPAAVSDGLDAAGYGADRVVEGQVVLWRRWWRR
jgi:SAM-dependent methyltransferase